MTREYKEIEIPARKDKRQTAFVCDFCGRRTHQDHCGNASWEDSPYDINIIRISREVGTSFPEGTNKVIEEWDICPDCFDTKIRPILPPPITSEIDH